jgi:type I restriction enzyme S subunit
MNWFGELPAGWNTVNVRNVFSEVTDSNIQLETTTPLQFRFGDIVQKKNASTDKEYLDSIRRYTLVRPNDIIINGLNLNYDFLTQRVAIVKENGCITPAYIVLRAVNSINPMYFCYLLKTMDAKKIINGLGTGIRLTLSYNEFRNEVLPLPPPEEQTRIVRFLDEKTAAIDKLIAAKQREAALLGELRKTIINYGINGNGAYAPTTEKENSSVVRRQAVSVDFRSSLKRGRIKELCDLQRGYDLPVTDFIDGDIPVYGSNGVIGYHNKAMAKAPGITIGRSGSVGEVNYIKHDFWPHNTSIFVTDFRGNNSMYIYYILKSINIKDLSAGSAVPTLDRKKVLNVIVNYTTDIGEQNNTVTRLDAQCAKIDAAIAAITRETALLAECRTRLIADAVTGQLRPQRGRNCERIRAQSR